MGNKYNHKTNGERITRIKLTEYIQVQIVQNIVITQLGIFHCSKIYKVIKLSFLQYYQSPALLNIYYIKAL